MACHWLSPTDVETKRWDDYVIQHPQAHHYLLSGWGRVIEQAYQHRPLYAMAENRGRITGVLPLICMQRWGFSRVLTSMPFVDYGGICADDDSVRAMLLEQALKACRQRRAHTLDLRHYHPSGLGLQTFENKAALVLPLDPNPDQMWIQFDAKVRNQVRKAMKSNLTVQWAGIEGIEPFYRVWTANMRDLGSPAHSLPFFRAVFEMFPSTRLALVSTPDEVVGGALCLYFRDTVTVPWASSRREFLRYCPNNLLYWEVIRAACEAGYRTFDFGRSSYGSGTYRFKKQWGAVEHPLAWEYWSQSRRSLPIVQTDSRSLYRAAMSLWRHLPLPLTVLVGPHIRRHLSN